CPASNQRLPCAAGCSRAQDPSGASPARSSARQTPGATDNTSPRSPRSGGLRPPCSGPAKPEHRLAAASQRSLQACIASLPLQSSLVPSHGTIPELPYLLQKFGGNFVGHTAILTSGLPKFLPWNMPIKEEGAFSSPSAISSRYLRRPVRTHSLTSRKKSGCFEAKSETMNPRRRRRLRNTENMSGPGIGLVALYCAIR